MKHLRAERELHEQKKGQHNLYWKGYDTELPLQDPAGAMEEHQKFVEGVLHVMPDCFPEEWHTVTTSHTRLSEFLNKVLKGIE